VQRLHLSDDAAFAKEAIRAGRDGSTAIVTGTVIGGSATGTVLSHFVCAATQHPGGEWSVGVEFQ